MYIWRGENYRSSVLHLRECSLSAKRPKTFLTFLLRYVPYSIRDFFLTVVLTIPPVFLHAVLSDCDSPSLSYK
jgi:hypothetical protein